MRRALLWILALVLLLSACGPGAANLPATPTPLPTAIVLAKPTYTVQRGTVVDSLAFTGRVSPVREAPLYFRIAGRVLQVHVARSDSVHAGDLLAELDVSALHRQLAQTELALQTARSDLDSAESVRSYDLARARLNQDLEQIALDKLKAYDPNLDVAVAQINLNAAIANVQQAQADYDAAGLPESEREYRARALQQATLAQDQAQAQYNQAVQQAAQHAYDIQSQEKRVALAQLEVDRLRASPDPRLAQAVAKAELELEDVRAQISDTVVLAPFDGQVLAVNTAAGQAVEGFQPVIVVADPGELEVTAELSAADLGKLSEGLTATIIPTGIAGEEFSATVRLLPYPYGSGGSSGDVSDKDQTVHLVVDLRGAAVKAGDLVQVTVVLQQKEGALWLPPAAIRTFQGRQFVVVQDGAVQQRVNVTLGIESKDRVEITSGLEEGQVVIGP